MNTQQQEQPEARLCATGCGFFANPNCGELCSKCSRDQQASTATAKAIASSAAPAIVPISHPSGDTLAPLAMPQAVQAASQPQPAGLPAQGLSLPTNPPASPAAEAADAGGLPAVQPPLSPKVLEAVSAAAEAALAGSSGQKQKAASAADSADAEEDGPPRRVQKNTSRCFSCNKKIGLTGFKCRCGFVFCGPHRLAEAHDCDFDYRSAGRESLAKANPLVQADRVARF